MALFRDSNNSTINHDRSLEDRRRHKELVENSIKDNLSEILSEESIVGETEDKKIKIPIKGIKEYSFIYGRNNDSVASGNSNQKRGDKLGKEDKKAMSENNSAGNEDGDDVYETEITVEEAIDYLLEDLELPNLEDKKTSANILSLSIKKRGYQKYGIRPRFAKKRTMIEKIKRKQSYKRSLGERKTLKKPTLERFPFILDDMRYFRIKKTVTPESNAAIIFIMDVSGSMDNSKKFLARSLFFVLSRFIRKKYNTVEVAFVSHSTVAKEVDEYEFFHKVESGGTYISSGFNKALQIIKTRFNHANWNIYTFYASDGDNWSEDDDRAILACKELLDVCNLVGYSELLRGYSFTSIKDKFLKEIKSPKFRVTSVNARQDLWKGIRDILDQKEKKEGDIT